MFPIINIGPLAIQSAGLFIILGLWLSINLIEKYCHQFVKSERNFINLLTWTLFSIIIFSRIAYIIQFSSDFLLQPLTVFSLSPALMDFNTGIIFSAILFIILLKRNNYRYSDALTALTPGISLFLFFYFFSLFSTGDYYGLPTELPWGIKLWGLVRHPLQIYYLIGAILIFIYIILQIRNNKVQTLFQKFLIAWSLLVIFLDFFRGDNQFIFFNVHIFQLVALIILIWNLLKINQTQDKTKDYLGVSLPAE